MTAVTAVDLAHHPGRAIVSILWPAFIVALLAEFVFFALVDPAELPLLGLMQPLSRPAVYTFGFFSFWGLGCLSSSLTLYFLQATRTAGSTPS